MGCAGPGVSEPSGEQKKVLGGIINLLNKPTST